MNGKAPFRRRRNRTCGVLPVGWAKKSMPGSPSAIHPVSTLPPTATTWLNAAISPHAHHQHRPRVSSRNGLTTRSSFPGLRLLVRGIAVEQADQDVRIDELQPSTFHGILIVFKSPTVPDKERIEPPRASRIPARTRIRQVRLHDPRMEAAMFERFQGVEGSRRRRTISV